MGKLQKILIMAGGTGGHVFPGLAVAAECREQGVEVHWLGTQKGLEARVVSEAGIPIHFISISGVRGKGFKAFFLMPFRLFYAVIQAFFIIKRLKPNLVLGLGGFVSGPGGIASWLLRRPLVIHEQNAKAGLTNKCLARVAAKVLEGFPNTFLSNRNAITAGNPVRAEMTCLPIPQERLQGRDKPLHLLVVGGSLGAAVINNLVPAALAKLPENERPLVYHQTGEKHLENTLKAYQAAGVKGKVVPFITDMDKAYGWADLVLCRAGALTVSELCAVGLGAILVPYPHAVDDHQTANANYLVNNQAALLIQQTELTEDGLAALLQQLSALPDKRIAMAEAAYQLRQVNATATVFKFCEEVSR